MKYGYWMVWICLVSVAVKGWTQMDADEAARVQKIVAYEYEGPKWKQGVSLDLMPGKSVAKIEEAGRGDSFEFVVMRGKARFCRVGDGIALSDLLKAIKRAGLDPEVPFPKEDAFLQSGKQGDGFLAGDSRTIWICERKVDPMSDAVSYLIEVDLRQGISNRGLLALLGGGLLGKLFGQNQVPKPKTISMSFDGKGQLQMLAIGKGAKPSQTQVRVDKNRFFEINSPIPQAKEKILDQMLKGETLITRFNTELNNHESLLSKMELIGFQAAYDYMMWHVKRSPTQ